MLSYLRIRGLALLDDVALEFSPGMNVLTGETGAGKSIIVDALSLVRGVRGRSEIVREGADAAVVDAQFDLEGSVAECIMEVLQDHGLPEEASPLVLQRSVPRKGRGRTFVQAELTTLGVLAKIGEQLVDICSQHEHHSLTQVARHLELLDAHAQLDAAVEEYETKYRDWRAAESALEELQARTAEGLRRADYLRFQIEEIERVAPEPGEYEALQSRLRVLREAHAWAEFATKAQNVLYESDDAVVGRLGALLERARRGAEDVPVLAEIQEQLAAAQAACEEASRMASRFADELQLEPGDLEHGEDRLHELETLRRKHGVEPDELAGTLEQMREDLDAIDNAEDHLRALEGRTAELHDACRALAERLHRRRAGSTRKLGQAVERELSALHMGNARFSAELQRTEVLGPRGTDRCEFVFSANRGEPMAPLNKVASGGELSRVLLAVKGILATGDTVSTYVFDEIDAGVGGAVAEAIGQRLRRAADRHQVLCITHLPQIAAFAQAHFRVEKHTRGKRTVTRVVRLDEDERVEELARMLGGARVSESARKHARQLLRDAQGGKPTGSGRRRAARP